MIKINSKIRTLAAVILSVCSAAAILSSCGEKNDTGIITEPIETVVGTNGEILGVTYYTEENRSEIYTALFEITTKKSFGFKFKKEKTGKTEANNISDNNNTETVKIPDKTEKDNAVQINGTEKSTRPRPTFPPTTTKKADRIIITFANGSTAVQGHVPISLKPDPVTEKKTTTVKRTDPQKTTSIQSNLTDETVKEESNGINIVFKTNSAEKGNTASIMIQGTPGKKYSIDFYENHSTASVHSDLNDKTADENGFVTWAFTIPHSCETGNRKIIIKENGSSNFVQTSIKVK